MEYKAITKNSFNVLGFDKNNTCFVQITESESFLRHGTCSLISKSLSFPEIQNLETNLILKINKDLDLNHRHFELREGLYVLKWKIYRLKNIKNIILEINNKTTISDYLFLSEIIKAIFGQTDYKIYICY